MTWWKKLTKSMQDNKEEKTEFPVQFELIPNMLFVRIYLTDLPTQDGVVPCWTYVTNGLLRHNQKELIFSLRRYPDQNTNSFPRAPLNIFTDIYRFAENGKLVDAGDISEFATSSFLNHKGLLYIRPDASQFVEDLDAALAIIMLTEDEVEAVKMFGPARVMARFGQREHYYPYPPWSDQEQPSLSFKASIQQSILTQSPRLWLRGIKVRMENNSIILRLLPHIAEYLQVESDTTRFCRRSTNEYGLLGEWLPRLGTWHRNAPPLRNYPARQRWLTGVRLLY